MATLRCGGVAVAADLIPGVSERLLRVWRTGERRYAKWASVDAALQALDLFWWEVFDPVDAERGLFSGERSRDLVAWLWAAELAVAAWEVTPGVGERVHLAGEEWRIESWDDDREVFWLARNGSRRAMTSADLEELM